jgi:hypothetical protein
MKTKQPEGIVEFEKKWCKTKGSGLLSPFCYIDDVREFLQSQADKTRGEVLEEIKRKLPTHKGNMISRTEIKKLLNELKKK